MQWAEKGVTKMYISTLKSIDSILYSDLSDINHCTLLDGTCIFLKCVTRVLGTSSQEEILPWIGILRRYLILSNSSQKERSGILFSEVLSTVYTVHSKASDILYSGKW